MTNKLTTEQLFDILPLAVTVYEKVGIKAYRQNMIKENAKEKKGEVDSMELGIDLFLHVLKNSKKIKTEIFEIVATVEGLSIEEAKEQNPGKTIETIKSIFTNKAATSLFQSVVH